MSTTSTEVIPCPDCGSQQTILIVESANIQRFPEFRKQLLDGTFMRFTCSSCSASFVVDAELLYTDLEQRLFIAVFPPERRAQVKDCETVLERTYQQVFVEEAPAFARAAIGDLHRRVVFGYEELREKVVCFAAGLDDHIIEAVKLALHDSQPELTRLSLQRCEGDFLWFARIGTMEPPFGVHRSMYDAMADDTQQIQLLLQPLWSSSYVSAEKCRAA